MAGTSYVGKAGHLAAMAEFLLRGYNVAMPEVDVGDDIFVVHDKDGTLWRVQVKTSIATRRNDRYLGQFSLAVEQLKQPKQPDLFYVLALRCGLQWEFVVIARELLYERYQSEMRRLRTSENWVLHVTLSEAQVIGGRTDLQAYRNNWNQKWPIIGE